MLPFLLHDLLNIGGCGMDGEICMIYDSCWMIFVKMWLSCFIARTIDLGEEQREIFHVFF